jgi:hydroxyethylthiazole kinase-like sugar kinase family protein
VGRPAGKPKNEQEAKAFAKAKQADGLNVNAGTINPYQPKRIVTSVQISGWLNEPDLDCGGAK